MYTVLHWLLKYEYLAMFVILTLCGLGLPLPEEVTLLASGLLVGWHKAAFVPATLACGAGILLGDICVYALGRYFAPFLHSRLLRHGLSPARQAIVDRFFIKHGHKTLFLARFFPGVRLGVYAYAGAQKVAWWRFLCLDGLGVLLSAPLSLWLGQQVGQNFQGDEAAALHTAQRSAQHAGRWLLLVVLGVLLLGVVLQRCSRLWRRAWQAKRT